MRRVAKLLTVVPVALAFAACDSGDQMTAPDYQSQTRMVATPVATETAATAKSAPSTESTVRSPIARFEGTGSAMRFKGAVGADIVGAEGGTVYVWGQGLIAQLVIPQGALDAPTVVIVRIDADKRISVSAAGKDNEADFLKPVRLYFNPKLASGSHGNSGKLMASGSSSFGTMTTKSSASGAANPNSPPPGDGWVWVESTTFTGWIILD